MSGVVGVVASAIVGEKLVKPLRVAAEENTEKGGKTHGKEHIQGGFLGS